MFVKDHAYEERCHSCPTRSTRSGFEYCELPAARLACGEPHAPRASTRGAREAARRAQGSAQGPAADRVRLRGSRGVPELPPRRARDLATHPHAKDLSTPSPRMASAATRNCLRCHTPPLRKPGGSQAGGGATARACRRGLRVVPRPGGDHVGADARQTGHDPEAQRQVRLVRDLADLRHCHDDANDPGFEFEVIDKVRRQRHGKDKLDIDGGRKRLPPSAALGLLERAFAGGRVSRNVATHDARAASNSPRSSRSGGRD